MPNFPISLVHPTGNPFARNAAVALESAGLLQEVVTTIGLNPKGSLAELLKLLPGSMNQIILQELGRRSWHPVQPDRIKTHPWREIVRVGLSRTGWDRRLNLNSQALTDWIYADLDRHVAHNHLQDLRAIYAYEDGAATTFEAARKQGILCLYDLPIPFYRFSREIQLQEAQQFPDLASALQATQEPTWKILRKEQEIQLADHIFVASSVTQQSLLQAGIAADKVTVIPYGAPIEYFSPDVKGDQPFRALFVGRVGPRKGVHYLLKAWKELHLPEAELSLIGIEEFPKGWLGQYGDLFRYTPSVPHQTLNQYYRAASVLVFPSLVEGFGLVLLEAMACGIPVITTPNTAGPDILTDGVEGFIIPIRDVEALKEKLEWCYRSPLELLEMGLAARRKAEQLTWNLYRQRLVAKIQELTG